MSYRMIEDYLWKIQYYLMRNYGSMNAEFMMYPLRWYIKSGHASITFFKLLMRKRPYLIGRVLRDTENCSIDDTVNAVIKYIGYEGGEV